MTLLLQSEFASELAIPHADFIVTFFVFTSKVEKGAVPNSLVNSSRKFTYLNS